MSSNQISEFSFQSEALKRLPCQPHHDEGKKGKIVCPENDVFWGRIKLFVNAAEYVLHLCSFLSYFKVKTFSFKF